MNAIELIEAQQKGKEGTPAYMVGEQLKDICRAEPASAELVAQDLANGAMPIEDCEKKIKAYADCQTKKGNCVCVPPNVAEGIIREFYGLPRAGEQIATPSMVRDDSAGGDFLNLDDFL